MTYLTQWLEYCFHTAGVIGSNPIVGRARTYSIPESVISNKFFYSHLIFFIFFLFHFCSFFEISNFFVALEFDSTILFVYLIVYLI